MKKFLIICFLCGLIAGCTTTKLTWVYKAADFNPAVYKKLAVIAIVPKNEARIEIEDAVVAQLRAKGIKAVTTWSIFVFANNPELLKKAGFEGDKKAEIIRQKMAQHNIDALLTITLFDKKNEQHYSSGPTVGIGVSAPAYGYPYSTYYTYAVDLTSQPGYYETTTSYLLESNLYDIASEKLLWTGQTSTDMNYDLQNTVVGFSQVMVGRLLEDSKPKKK
ncbi:MAG: hypothetical protein NTU98_09630 [Bacteroidetes bacterium]|nr:hypothetical protein [Bacteroidota bacterium]